MSCICSSSIGSRSGEPAPPTLSADGERRSGDDGQLPDVEAGDESDFFVDDSDVFDDEDSVDFDEPDDEALLSVLDEPPSDDELAGLDDDVLDERLSVLKNPDPLNVTPTGVNTFLTGRTSPVWGWASSVSVSSVKPCWTSTVSPESTNL